MALAERGVTIESIYNYRHIDDRIASGGQPTVEQLAAVRDAGYCTVINLAPHDAASGALPDEAGVVRDLGLAYVHIPVAWEHPTRADFDAFCAAMARSETERVFIHCAANFRVTAFYARHARLYGNRSAEELDALVASVWESRPDYRMDDTWKAFLAGDDSDV